MEVKRSTFRQLPNSVLCKQFADPVWNSKLRSQSEPEKSPTEWDSKQVVQWIATTVPGITEEMANMFSDITGTELLALKREDLLHLGITRTGSVAVIMDAIEKLARDDASIAKNGSDSATFIEHSEYCFSKIIDQLRQQAMSKVLECIPTPRPPEIREPDKKRFKRIVEYYFPHQDEAKAFLE